MRRRKDPSPVPLRLVKAPAAGHPLPKGEGCVSNLSSPGERAKSPSLRKGVRRFPTFEIPAGAPMIPASRIERVLDEV